MGQSHGVAMAKVDKGKSEALPRLPGVGLLDAVAAAGRDIISKVNRVAQMKAKGWTVHDSGWVEDYGKDYIEEMSQLAETTDRVAKETLSSAQGLDGLKKEVQDTARSTTDYKGWCNTAKSSANSYSSQLSTKQIELRSKQSELSGIRANITSANSQIQENQRLETTIFSLLEDYQESKGDDQALSGDVDLF